MDVFTLLFILSFIALYVTLVVLHIRECIDKSNQSNVAKGSKHLSWISTMLGKQESSRRESYGFTKEKAARISLNTQKVYMRSYDLESSMMKREVNEVQEKWKESLPKHSTRIKLRNKRKEKK